MKYIVPSLKIFKLRACMMLNPFEENYFTLYVDGFICQLTIGLPLENTKLSNGFSDCKNILFCKGSVNFPGLVVLLSVSVSKVLFVSSSSILSTTEIFLVFLKSLLSNLLVLDKLVGLFILELISLLSF